MVGGLNVCVLRGYVCMISLCMGGCMYVCVYVEMVVMIQYSWLCSGTVTAFVNGSFCFFCRVS